MFLPWGPAVLRYQVEGFHFLSLWAGSWPRGTISLLAPAGLSTQPMGDTTCSTTAPDGAALGPRRKGCVFVLVCIKYLRVTRKDFCSRGTELQHYLRPGWNGTAETHRRCGVKVWFDEIVAQARIPPLSHTHTHIRSHRMSVRQWAVLTLNWISLSLSLVHAAGDLPIQSRGAFQKANTAAAISFSHIQTVMSREGDPERQREWDAKLRVFTHSMFPFLASCAIVKVAQKRQDKNLNGLLAMHCMEMGYFNFRLDGLYNTLYFWWLGYLP